MRITTPIIIAAAALLAATPAVAQNEPANAIDNAANAVAATDANLAVPPAAPANEVAATPEVNTLVTPPVVQEKPGFPWGVLGLLGLLGLIPRGRRRG